MDSREPTLWRLISEATTLLYRAAPEPEWCYIPGAALVFSGVPVAYFNRILISGLHEDQLREYVHRAQKRSLPCIVALSMPVANDLTPIVQELGLNYAVQAPVMVYQPDQRIIAKSRYTVTPLEEHADLEAAIAVAAQAFSIAPEVIEGVFGFPCTVDPGCAVLDGPGVTAFLAREGDTPVSAVWTTRSGPVVGIWLMGTASEHQRQGAGRALLDAVIAYHQERGVTLFYLWSSVAGKALYQQIGFQMVADAAVWVWQPSAVDSPSK